MFEGYRNLLLRLNTTTRLAMGLSGIVVSVLLVGALLGLIPNQTSLLMQSRAAMAEAIAVNSSVFITQSDLWRMEVNLQMQVARNDALLSAGIRRQDGKLLSSVGDQHAAHWVIDEQARSTDSQLSVPIWEGEKLWGNVELRFSPLRPSVWYAFIYDPFFQLMLLVMVISFGLFYFYLGKMLKHLDPSQAIPDRVRSAFDTMAEGLLVLDAQQNIVLANEAFSQLVGIESLNLVGRDIDRFEWQRAADSTEEKYPWQLALERCEATMSRMIRLPAKDGKLITFMTNCSPVLAGSGKAAGVLVSLDDVTLLEEKEIELRKSRDEAEAANRAKSDFLANMSHEIRTPMNAILGFTEVLKRGYGKNPTQSAQYLNTIANSGEHLLGLINDILDLSKVEAGQVDVETIRCPLHHVIAEVIQIMQVKAQEKGLYLEYQPGGAMPEYIHSDPSRVRQILTNLIGNAIKFTETGGVTVVTQWRQNAGGEHIVLEVSDTGIGMSQSQADAVFAPFVQADSSITRRFGGTGLGLTISKRFAEALGGDIVVRSVESQGSTFSVTLATGDTGGARELSVAELTQARPVEAHEVYEHWQFEPQPVLVVDDGAENRSLLEVLLGDTGLQVDLAENGQQACDKAFNGAYAMILMDVQMPVMDGYSAVAKMRAHGLTMPIIALTAHAMKGVEQQCLQAGYTGYMTKPIKIDRLFKLVADTLGVAQVKPDMVKPDMLATVDTPAVEQADRAAVVPVSDLAMLSSSLPIDKPAFKKIVADFIGRLDQQVMAMDQACADGDWVCVADLAHWLKGSAGSVGFPQFTDPAIALEFAAQAAQSAQVEQHISVIRQLQRRILPVAQREEGNGPAPYDGLAGQQIDFEEHRRYGYPDVIVSRLAASGEKFSGILARFKSRLDEQMREVAVCIEREDYASVAQFAHWLKGSAGSVGYDVFTEPAIDLEIAAKANEREVTSQVFGVLTDMNQRVSVDSH